VVIVGGGFAGLTAARELADAPVDVTLVDRSNHHLFQPLLYQVATAGLSPAEIAAPIRGILSGQHNLRVLMANVEGVDLDAQTLRLDASVGAPLHYDQLILAAGAINNFFGHDAWGQHALGLKTIDDAVEIRRRVLMAFEAAEREPDPARQRELLTFVVIGGGPTGVEMAGALAELSRFVLAEDFQSIRPRSTRVMLVEAGPRVLAGFHPDLSARAEGVLRDLHVEVRTLCRVMDIQDRRVTLGDEVVHASVIIWGAGVKGSELGAMLGAPLDRGGRVLVEKDCSLPGRPNVFVLGDMAAFTHTPDGKALPGVSPVAMQQARYVAKVLASDNRQRPAFEYVDKGSMATIGRSQAVMESGPIRLHGFVAWLGWLFVHIWYLIGFRSRAVVMLTWMWSYLTYKRGARLITGPRITTGKDTWTPAGH
jgi:NADH dehydrogenase